jgi:hypothetical protein
MSQLAEERINNEELTADQLDCPNTLARPDLVLTLHIDHAIVTSGAK